MRSSARNTRWAASLLLQGLGIALIRNKGVCKGQNERLCIAMPLSPQREGKGGELAFEGIQQN
eukprot:1298764-Rhodomonas_salina.2